jgi:glycosyltransferase involved in cell wall biosynthesis
MNRVLPRILLNDNIVSPRMQRGVARYFRTITDGIITYYGQNVTVCSPAARCYGEAKYVPSVRFRGSRRLGLQDKWASAIALVEHPTILFSAYYGAARSRAKHVYTVYDMIVERFPKYFPADNPHVRRFTREKKACLEGADILFAISSSVARDIVDCYPSIDANKISVTPLGVDSHFFQAGNQGSTKNARPFFLYVGNRTLYKNFSRLLEAFGYSGLGRDFDLRVISPGGSGFTRDEAELVAKYDFQQHVDLLTSVSDAELCKQYANAQALVCPSEYEGFGLPILEAMASGTLVAMSNTSSMPEVGGDVALYFEPHDAESMANCLMRVACLSSEERRERIEQGVARARTFTWERCQQQTVDVLQRLGVTQP